LAVYWLQRPPYLRWTAAAILVLGAALWDLRGDQRHTRPFLTASLPAGSRIPAEAVEWREVPADLLVLPELSGRVTAVDLQAGDPLIPSVLAPAVTAPTGWWSVPVQIGRHAEPGDEVMLVTIDPPLTVPGIVLEAESGDAYSLDFRPAVVAVPGESAPVVAAAAGEGRIVAVVRP
jgi:hypothetical protein